MNLDIAKVRVSGGGAKSPFWRQMLADIAVAAKPTEDVARPLRKLAKQAATVREAGATELRLYHAGLASARDLAAIRTQLARLGA